MRDKPLLLLLVVELSLLMSSVSGSAPLHTPMMLSRRLRAWRTPSLLSNPIPPAFTPPPLAFSASPPVVTLARRASAWTPTAGRTMSSFPASASEKLHGEVLWHHRHSGILPRRPSRLSVSSARLLALSAKQKDALADAALADASAPRPAKGELRPLNKAVYDNAQICVRKAWFHRRGQLPADAKSLEASQHLLQQGIDFEAAYVMWRYGGEGETVEGGGLQESARQTRALMEEAEEAGKVGDAIFQATFLHEGVVAKADVLEYAGEGQWDLYEVKSCGCNSYRGYLPDLAFTGSAARRAGVSLRRTVMVTVNTEAAAGSHEELFATFDCTDELLTAQEGLIPMLEESTCEQSLDWALQATGGGGGAPEAEAGLHCKKCELFAECVGKGLSHPIWELPRLSSKRFVQLASQSLEIQGIDGDGLTPQQLRHWRAVQERGWVVDEKGLSRELGKMSVPYLYLDFESCAGVKPLFEGVRPFETVVTQYSLHSCRELEGEVTHVDYLAEGGRDCRRELLERLVGDLGTEGSIVVYSSYEKTQLKALAERFPDMLSAVEGIIERLVDFEGVIKKHVSHPLFRGRSSLKVTLPVLVPEYEGKYQGMAVSDGGQASARFNTISQGGLPPLEVERLRQDLLDYCELDTLAMLELHRALAGLAERE